MVNEGLLSKHHFEGEVVHTGDHPPVFRWGVPADSCPAMGAGMLLTAADGKISPSNGSGAIVGVLDDLAKGKLKLSFGDEYADREEPSVAVISEGRTFDLRGF